MPRGELKWDVLAERGSRDPPVPLGRPTPLPSLWGLGEVGANYEMNVMPFPPRYRAKQFMAINPLGTIPALVDGETFMTESAAIVQYLATRYGPSPLAVDVGDSAYGAWLNWLHFGEATLTFPQTLVLRYRRL